ncbi:hypothetical protein [Streptomyces sp. NBC_01506]|uniref:hypothetical protein n=1 Tax=Streptomyces sp. NBC_01506 TaxID=2903887 RepID=UPI003869F68C
MNTKRVTAAADVICAAMRNGKALPLSWAAALESACLLQSPETAVEMAEVRDALAEAVTACDGLETRLLATETARDALRAQVAELEAQRDRRRGRLVALQNDALNMRGALSPNGRPRRVPMELGEALTPAVEWLLARVEELEAGVPAILRLGPSRATRRVQESLRRAAADLDTPPQGESTAFAQRPRPLDALDSALRSAFDQGEPCDADGNPIPAEVVPLGELAEQAHLLDPLDHAFEALPVRAVVPLGEMQRANGDPVPDASGGAS